MHYYIVQKLSDGRPGGITKLSSGEWKTYYNKDIEDKKTIIGGKSCHIAYKL